MKNIIALGFFDGVHIGHRQILKRTTELGREMGLKPCAFTMSNHPRGVLTGEPPLKLTSFEERVSLIKREGIEEVFAVEFTKDFAAKTPMEFAEMIKNEYNALFNSPVYFDFFISLSISDIEPLHFVNSSPDAFLK